MSAVHTTTPSQSQHRPTHRAGTGSHHWWRWVAGVVVLVLVAFLGAAWYFSGRIYSGALASTPFTYPPAFDDVRVVSVTDGRVTLDKGPDAGASFDAPASYGMVWDGGRGYVGPATAVDADTVARDLTVADGSAPVVGAMAAYERAYWLGSDPSSLGLEWTDVSVAGPDGALPAWFFPAEGDQTTMAVVVHGQNGSRLDGLRVVDTLHRLGMPALVVTYRNDAGAPADASGQLGYGATEWPDLQAAVSWATEHGASDIVLVGQSMGGGVVAAFLESSPQAAVVSRVVLDAPMLSLAQVVDYGARTAMPVTGGAVPTPIIWAAEQIASLRFGLDWSAVDYLDDTAWVRVPTLVVHGLDDPTVPATVSQELATGVPDLVTLQEFPGALHVESWNTDRTRWTQVVTQFLSTEG